jgi:F0F1-type ATP synthase assembly protein I
MEPNEPRPESTSSNMAASMRKAQPFIDAAWQFAASVGLMCWLGYLGDKRFDTKPWLLVAGSLLGFAAGIWSFVKVVMAQQQGPRPGGNGPDGKGRA